ncbi:MAG: RHS repeat-associated core domain-containing protein, partial [Planctomycetota bacterium]
LNIPGTSETVQEHQYDARNFRTVRKNYSSGTLSETRHFYYTPGWQALEERLGTTPDSAAPDRHFVWGLRYIDDLVLRERDTDLDGRLDERLYSLQDANWNVVALINPSGAAEERYQYTPFGTPIILTGSMSAVRSSSAVGMEVLFTGQRFEELTKLHLFRMRWFDSLTGRFIGRDPLGYPDGMNAYAGWFVPNTADAFGLESYLLGPIINGVQYPWQLPWSRRHYDKVPPPYRGFRRVPKYNPDDAKTFATFSMSELIEKYGLGTAKPEYNLGQSGQLSRGCIGSTAWQLGVPHRKPYSSIGKFDDYYKTSGPPNVNLSHCYATIEEARAVESQWKQSSTCNPTKSAKNVFGDATRPRLIVLQFHDRDWVLNVHPDGRYDLEANNIWKLLAEANDYGNSGNFDFAVEMAHEQFLHADHHGGTFSLDNLTAIYKQFDKTRAGSSNNYDFNAQFFCVACDTPWEDGHPKAPIVPK